MHRLIAAALAATVCAQGAQAQNIPPVTMDETITLERALALAGATVPSVEASSAAMRAAEAQRRIAGLRPNPSINVETENVIGTGPYSGISSAETTVGMSVPLELGGKRAARIGVADAQTARARLDVTSAHADLTLRVTQAFNEAVASERRLVIAREQMGIAEEGLRVARVRVRAGKASPIEEQRAEVARVNSANAVDRAQRSASLARSNLGRLIGRTPGSLDTSWFDGVDGLDPHTPASLEGTLALAIAEADAATATAQVRLARSRRVPDLTLSAGTRRLEATNDVAAVFGVSLPLPVFNNGRADVEAASAQRAQAVALGRMARLDAEQAIASAETDVANAHASARTATGPALAAAQEAARIARIGYREGKFGQLDLLEAERTLAETRVAAIDALSAYHDAKARLARLTVPAPTATEDQQ